MADTKGKTKKIVQKKDGVITVYDYTPELYKQIKGSGHKCWEDCENATVLKCKKMADILKYGIDKYPFITDGFQIVDGDKIEQFVVLGCKNYVKEVRKKLTPEELAEVKKAKENLRTMYFDAETIREAGQNQISSLRRAINEKIADNYAEGKSKLEGISSILPRGRIINHAAYERLLFRYGIDDIPLDKKIDLMLKIIEEGKMYPEKVILVTYRKKEIKVAIGVFAEEVRKGLIKTTREQKERIKSVVPDFFDDEPKTKTKK